MRKPYNSKYNCSDGFCGADDCRTCHPGCYQGEEENDSEPDIPDEDPEDCGNWPDCFYEVEP